MYKDKEKEKKWHKEYYKKNKVKISKYQRERKQNNLEKIILKGAKDRAKEKNIPFNIELLDIIIPEYCPILKIKLDTTISGRRSYRPSLDRIDNSKGYIKGNIAIISNRANRLKQDSTIEELEAILKYMKGLLN